MMEGSILVTGAEGLIGAVLVKNLEQTGPTTLRVDLKDGARTHRIDICNAAALAPIIAQCSGIVHLAAVSRVIHGERDPKRCWDVNVDATRDIIHAALQSKRRPWLIYASSREVYGHPESFPVREDARFRPLNIYARSKVMAEELVEQARLAGLQTAILRFSTVYGTLNDHADRVVPAFVAAAVRGGTMRIDGEGCGLDATHVDDVVAGIDKVISMLRSGESKLPPIHFVSGVRTTLLDLANRANAIAGHKARIELAAPRKFDVHNFVGNPERARALLGWEATTSLDAGLARLAADFAGQGATA